LEKLTNLIDDMAAEASKLEPGGRLDLAVLPETAVTSPSGTVAQRAVPLDGPVRESFAKAARTHQCYIVATLDLAEPGPQGTSYANAAVLFNRQGDIAGIYRKRHPVALVGQSDLEGGITPGRDARVFPCDFGKLGIQICWDMVFDDGWQELADQGAEIIVWPSASPATVQPASRAARHRLYLVSSTWRNNATFYEPTGLIAARVEQPDRVLVHEIDLSFAVLGWSSFLEDGRALSKRFGDKVGYHYDPREDIGLFWSNDPATPIGTMIRAIGGEEIDQQIVRNRRLQNEARNASGVVNGLSSSKVSSGQKVPNH
jgi:predicted amidohydrolase